MQDVAGQPLIGDRYRILKKIGEGGMGEVYLAEHIYIEKRVAIKLLRPDVLSNQEAVTRFRQEARSASSIGHENIIQIDDFGTLPDGRIYMAMEFLQGEALNDILSHGPLPLPRALDILIQVTRALAAAHAKGITHRDMKPENVFVTQKDGRDVPKILDFGIAKVSGGDTGQNLTVAGAIFGTPFYMAPEQAMGGKMDHRVDIYAMGVILYEVFCGTVPFKAESFMGILTQHITTEPVPPTQMAAQNGRVIQPQLESIILKAMRKNANERYQSMNELTGALIDYYRFSVGTPISGYQVQQTGPRSRQVAVQGGSNKKLFLIIGGAVVAAVGIGIGVMKIVGGPTAAVVADAGEQKMAATPDAGATKPPPSPPDAAPPPPPSTPDAAPAAAGPADAGATAPPVKMISVKVTSRPSGAMVFVRGKRVCITPCVVEVAEGESQVLTLKKNAYSNGTVRVNGSRDEVSVELESELMVPP